MGRKCQRRRKRRDRISELPADIVDVILGLLPIKEASKMAVLSTFWRDMWFSLTRLRFDYSFLRHIMNKYSHSCSDIMTQTTLEKKKNSDIWMSAALYVISKVLNQHNGLICTFVIEFQYQYRNTLRSRSFDLDQWFLFVTRKGVEEIELSLMVEDEYRLPNCIFSCLTLRSLNLYGVSVESPNAPCTLPNVTSLWFDYVDFDGVDLLVPVDFPMLDDLSFMHSANLSNLNITAQKLDRLQIDDCRFYRFPINSDLRSVRTLGLDSYALKDFVKQCIGRGLQPQPLVLDVEYLIVVEHSSFRGDISSAFIHLLRICPKLCKLDLNLQFADDLPKLSEEFHTVAQGLEMLHNLNLTEFVACEDDIVFIKGLLSYFPALEEVVITRLDTCSYHEDFEKYKEELLHFSCASTKAKIIFMD